MPSSCRVKSAVARVLQADSSQLLASPAHQPCRRSQCFPVPADARSKPEQPLPAILQKNERLALPARRYQAQCPPAQRAARCPAVPTPIDKMAHRTSHGHSGQCLASLVGRPGRQVAWRCNASHRRCRWPMLGQSRRQYRGTQCPGWMESGERILRPAL